MQTPRDWLAPCAASLMLALLLAASPAGAEEPMPCTVPELIGGLAGQVGIDMVALSGTFKLTPEGPALFEDKEHAETAAGKDMIPLRDALDGRKTDYKPFEGKRVTAVGKFTIYKPGESTASKGYVTAERINVDPTFVSLMELIVSPEKFDGLTVVVAGRYQLTHRGPLLFLSKDDAENWIVANAIPLQPTASKENEDDTPFDGKFVRITGKFTAYKPDKVVVSKGYIIYEGINPCARRDASTPVPK